MKKRYMLVALLLAMAFLLTACGPAEDAENGISNTGKQPTTNEEKEEPVTVRKIGDQKLNFFQDNNIGEVDESYFVLSFSLRDEDGARVKTDINVDIKIVNDSDEVVYTKTKKIAKDDFPKSLAVEIDIPVAEMEKGINRKGVLTYSVYDDAKSFSLDAEAVTISNYLPLKPVVIHLPEFPVTIKNEHTEESATGEGEPKYDSYEYKITDVQITYALEEDNVVLTIKGEKTADTLGETYNRGCEIGWKLYTDGKRVQANSTTTSVDIAVGDQFKLDLKLTVSSVEQTFRLLPGEEYVLTFYNIVTK